MCNVLPKQSTGLFRRIGSTKTTCFVGENSCFPPHPFSAFLHLAVLTHGVTARRRAEVSPYGDKGSALDLQGGRVPLDSRYGVAVSGTLAAKL